MPPKGYKVITVKEELEPYVRQYYRKLLVSGPPRVDEEGEEGFVYVTVRVPSDKYASLSYSLAEFFGPMIDWIDPYGLVAHYVDFLETLTSCRTLKSAAQNGLIKDFKDVLESIVFDAEKILQDMYDKHWITLDEDHLYSKPFAILLKIANVLESSDSNKLQAKYVCDLLKLRWETLAIILEILERLGLVRVEIVGQYEKGDAFISLTELGKRTARFLVHVLGSVRLEISGTSNRFWWINAKIELVQYGLTKFAAKIHIGLEDAWLYLTDYQRNELTRLVRHTSTGTLFSKEALKKLLKMGIKIPSLDKVLEKMGDLLVSGRDLQNLPF